MASTAYYWQPIEDLPRDWAPLQFKELQALSQVWKEQRQTLEEEAVLKDFHERLNREWAIETGIIERVYTLDRGITQLLIEKGIDASLIPHGSTDRPAGMVVAMIRDHQEAVEGLFQFVKGERTLSTSYIKELHSVLTRHQESSDAVDPRGKAIQVPLLRGDYKKQPNNPHRQNGSVHQYCPPEQVASEMDRLIEMHCAHASMGVPPEVEAAWLHHRFTQIHPFQDGNGRVVRCLASLVFLKAGWFPLVITRDDRDRYILALERADAGDLRDLTWLFVKLEKKAFVNALGLTREVLHGTMVSQVIDSVRDTLLRQREELRKEWQRAKALAVALQEVCRERLERAKAEMQGKLGKLNPRFQFKVVHEPPDGARGHYFRHQIIEAAKELGYFADLRTHRAWTSLHLQTDVRSEILYSFHGVGAEFRGVIAVSAIFFRKSEAEEGERAITDITPLSDDIFQLNYRDTESDAKTRFAHWMDETLAKGLEAWRQGL